MRFDLRVWVSAGVSREYEDDHLEDCHASDSAVCGWNFAGDGAEPSTVGQ